MTAPDGVVMVSGVTQAMTLLIRILLGSGQASVEVEDPSTVIALWLGHADVRSTNTYLHADLTIQERALARVAPITAKTGR